jgi:hypothetical protein
MSRRASLKTPRMPPVAELTSGPTFPTCRVVSTASCPAYLPTCTEQIRPRPRATRTMRTYKIHLRKSRRNRKSRAIQARRATAKIKTTLTSTVTRLEGSRPLMRSRRKANPRSSTISIQLNSIWKKSKTSTPWRKKQRL